MLNHIQMVSWAQIREAYLLTRQKVSLRRDKHHRALLTHLWLGNASQEKFSKK